jgi:TonB family protein
MLEANTISMGRQGESVRDFDFIVKMLNQGDRRITEIAIEISHGQSVRLSYHTLARSSAPDAENRPQGIGAQEPTTFRLRLQLKETIEGEAVMNHLHDFRLKMLGVKYEGESAMFWSETAKKSYPQKGLIKPAPKPKPKSSQPADQDSASESFRQDDPVQPMSASRRPKILYKENAQYTKEARDQKVEGTVVLNLVFNADGNIENIRVVRGLPHGLTEAAIEAAKAIRFEPAMKDGQPISVRGNVEYSFRLKE